MRIWTCEAKIKKERITDEEKIIAHISPILQTFPNSLFDQESGRRKTTLWICYLQINQLFLFSFLIYFFIPLNLSNSNGQGCKQFFFWRGKKSDEVTILGFVFTRPIRRNVPPVENSCIQVFRSRGGTTLTVLKFGCLDVPKFERQIRGHLIMNGSA